MLREEFIIEVFCLISSLLKKINYNLRQRGPKPALFDEEILTMEVIGEFLRLDGDKEIHSYFKYHWFHYFPRMGDRSAFVRQSANLWNVKQLLQKELANQLLAFQDNFHIVDGFPMPICNFRRAYFSKIFKGIAGYGHCASKNQTYYGFKGHLLISLNGVITDFALTPANTDERDAALDFSETINGVLIGDKGYIGRKDDFKNSNIDLETPLRSNMKDNRPTWAIKMLNDARRLIETVIGQLTERFNIEKIRARDMWHLTSRIWRKLLAHTICIFVNVKKNNEFLTFEGLVVC